MKTYTTLYVVTNEDDNVTADADREVALKRMVDQYGGQHLDMMEVAIPKKRPADYLKSIKVRDGIDDDRFIHKT